MFTSYIKIQSLLEATILVFQLFLFWIEVLLYHYEKNLTTAEVTKGYCLLKFTSTVTCLPLSFLSNYCTIALISHTSKVMFKILQARLQ